MKVLVSLKTHLCYVNRFCFDPKCGILVCPQLVTASCGAWSLSAGKGLPHGAEKGVI